MELVHDGFRLGSLIDRCEAMLDNADDKEYTAESILERLLQISTVVNCELGKHDDPSQAQQSLSILLAIYASNLVQKYGCPLTSMNAYHLLVRCLCKFVTRKNSNDALVALECLVMGNRYHDCIRRLQFTNHVAVAKSIDTIDERFHVSLLDIPGQICVENINGADCFFKSMRDFFLTSTSGLKSIIDCIMNNIASSPRSSTSLFQLKCTLFLFLFDDALSIPFNKLVKVANRMSSIIGSYLEALTSNTPRREDDSHDAEFCDCLMEIAELSPIHKSISDIVVIYMFADITYPSVGDEIPEIVQSVINSLVKLVSTINPPISADCGRNPCRFKSIVNLLRFVVQVDYKRQTNQLKNLVDCLTMEICPECVNNDFYYFIALESLMRENGILDESLIGLVRSIGKSVRNDVFDQISNNFDMALSDTNLDQPFTATISDLALELIRARLTSLRGTDKQRTNAWLRFLRTNNPSSNLCRFALDVFASCEANKTRIEMTKQLLQKLAQGRIKAGCCLELVFIAICKSFKRPILTDLATGITDMKLDKNAILVFGSEIETQSYLMQISNENYTNILDDPETQKEQRIFIVLFLMYFHELRMSIIENVEMTELSYFAHLMMKNCHSFDVQQFKQNARSRSYLLLVHLIFLLKDGNFNSSISWIADLLKNLVTELKQQCPYRIKVPAYVDKSLVSLNRVWNEETEDPILVPLFVPIKNFSLGSLIENHCSSDLETIWIHIARDICYYAVQHIDNDQMGTPFKQLMLDLEFHPDFFIDTDNKFSIIHGNHECSSCQICDEFKQRFVKQWVENPSLWDNSEVIDCIGILTRDSNSERYFNDVEIDNILKKYSIKYFAILANLCRFNGTKTNPQYMIDWCLSTAEEILNNPSLTLKLTDNFIDLYVSLLNGKKTHNIDAVVNVYCKNLKPKAEYIDLIMNLIRISLEYERADFFEVLIDLAIDVSRRPIDNTKQFRNIFSLLNSIFAECDNTTNTSLIPLRSVKIKSALISLLHSKLDLILDGELIQKSVPHHLDYEIKLSDKSEIKVERHLYDIVRREGKPVFMLSVDVAQKMSVLRFYRLKMSFLESDECTLMGTPLFLPFTVTSLITNHYHEGLFLLALDRMCFIGQIADDIDKPLRYFNLLSGLNHIDVIDWMPNSTSVYGMFYTIPYFFLCVSSNWEFFLMKDMSLKPKLGEKNARCKSKICYGLFDEDGDLLELSDSAIWSSVHAKNYPGFKFIVDYCPYLNIMCYSANEPCIIVCKVIFIIQGDKVYLQSIIRIQTIRLDEIFTDFDLPIDVKRDYFVPGLFTVSLLHGAQLGYIFCDHRGNCSYDFSNPNAKLVSFLNDNIASPPRTMLISRSMPRSDGTFDFNVIKNGNKVKWTSTKSEFFDLTTNPDVFIYDFKQLKSVFSDSTIKHRMCSKLPIQFCSEINRLDIVITVNKSNQFSIQSLDVEFEGVFNSLNILYDSNVFVFNSTCAISHRFTKSNLLEFTIVADCVPSIHNQLKSLKIYGFMNPDSDVLSVRNGSRKALFDFRRTTRHECFSEFQGQAINLLLENCEKTREDSRVSQWIDGTIAELKLDNEAMLKNSKLLRCVFLSLKCTISYLDLVRTNLFQLLFDASCYNQNDVFAEYIFANRKHIRTSLTGYLKPIIVAGNCYKKFDFLQLFIYNLITFSNNAIEFILNELVINAPDSDCAWFTTAILLSYMNLTFEEITIGPLDEKATTQRLSPAEDYVFIDSLEKSDFRQEVATMDEKMRINIGDGTADFRIDTEHIHRTCNFLEFHISKVTEPILASYEIGGRENFSSQQFRISRIPHTDISQRLVEMCVKMTDTINSYDIESDRIFPMLLTVYASIFETIRVECEHKAELACIELIDRCISAKNSPKIDGVYSTCLLYRIIRSRYVNEDVKRFVIESLNSSDRMQCLLDQIFMLYRDQSKKCSNNFGRFFDSIIPCEYQKQISIILEVLKTIIEYNQSFQKVIIDPKQLILLFGICSIQQEYYSVKIYELFKLIRVHIDNRIANCFMDVSPFLITLTYKSDTPHIEELLCEMISWNHGILRSKYMSVYEQSRFANSLAYWNREKDFPWFSFLGKKQIQALFAFCYMSYEHLSNQIILLLNALFDNDEYLDMSFISTEQIKTFIYVLLLTSSRNETRFNALKCATELIRRHSKREEICINLTNSEIWKVILTGVNARGQHGLPRYFFEFSLLMGRLAFDCTDIFGHLENHLRMLKLSEAYEFNLLLKAVNIQSSSFDCFSDGRCCRCNVSNQPTRILTCHYRRRYDTRNYERVVLVPQDQNFKSITEVISIYINIIPSEALLKHALVHSNKIHLYSVMYQDELEHLGTFDIFSKDDEVQSFAHSIRRRKYLRFVSLIPTPIKELQLKGDEQLLKLFTESQDFDGISTAGIEVVVKGKSRIALKWLSCRMNNDQNDLAVVYKRFRSQFFKEMQYCSSKGIFSEAKSNELRHVYDIKIRNYAHHISVGNAVINESIQKDKWRYLAEREGYEHINNEFRHFFVPFGDYGCYSCTTDLASACLLFFQEYAQRDAAITERISDKVHEMIQRCRTLRINKIDALANSFLKTLACVQYKSHGDSKIIRLPLDTLEQFLNRQNSHSLFETIYAANESIQLLQQISSETALVTTNFPQLCRLLKLMCRYHKQSNTAADFAPLLVILKDILTLTKRMVGILNQSGQGGNYHQESDDIKSRSLNPDDWIFYLLFFKEEQSIRHLSSEILFLMSNINKQGREQSEEFMFTFSKCCEYVEISEDRLCLEFLKNNLLDWTDRITQKLPDCSIDASNTIVTYISACINSADCTLRIKKELNSSLFFLYTKPDWANVSNDADFNKLQQRFDDLACESCKSLMDQMMWFTICSKSIAELVESRKYDNDYHYVNRCVRLLKLMTELTKIPTSGEPQNIELCIYGDPVQNEFIQSSLGQDTFNVSQDICASDQAVSDLTMLDIRNFICAQLEYESLLDITTGMDLVVLNSLVNLQVRLVDVYKFLWIANNPETPTMIIMYRLSGLSERPSDENDFMTITNTDIDTRFRFAPLIDEAIASANTVELLKCLLDPEVNISIRSSIVVYFKNINTQMKALKANPKGFTLQLGNDVLTEILGLIGIITASESDQNDILEYCCAIIAFSIESNDGLCSLSKIINSEWIIKMFDTLFAEGKYIAQLSYLLPRLYAIDASLFHSALDPMVDDFLGSEQMRQTNCPLTEFISNLNSESVSGQELVMYFEKRGVTLKCLEYLKHENRPLFALKCLISTCKHNEVGQRNCLEIVELISEIKNEQLLSCKGDVLSGDAEELLNLLVNSEFVGIRNAARESLEAARLGRRKLRKDRIDRLKKQYADRGKDYGYGFVNEIKELSLKPACIVCKSGYDDPETGLLGLLVYVSVQTLSPPHDLGNQTPSEIFHMFSQCKAVHFTCCEMFMKTDDLYFNSQPSSAQLLNAGISCNCIMPIKLVGHSNLDTEYEEKRIRFNNLLSSQLPMHSYWLNKSPIEAYAQTCKSSLLHLVYRHWLPSSVMLKPSGEITIAFIFHLLSFAIRLQKNSNISVKFLREKIRHLNRLIHANSHEGIHFYAILCALLYDKIEWNSLFLSRLISDLVNIADEMPSWMSNLRNLKEIHYFAAIAYFLLICGFREVIESIFDKQKPIDEHMFALSDFVDANFDFIREKAEYVFDTYFYPFSRFADVDRINMIKFAKQLIGDNVELSCDEKIYEEFVFKGRTKFASDKL
ncbi:hypothetical protein ACOME3_004538 [Neoechinorhynchus agilis]